MATGAREDERTHSPPHLAAALLDALPVGAACIDADARLVVANDAFAAAVGARAPSSPGAAPEHLGRLAAAARDVIATGVPVELRTGTDGVAARVSRLDERHAAVVLAAAPTPAPPRADDQAALRRLATLVARGAPLETVFALASEAIARCLGVEAAAALRYIGDQRAVVVGVWREGGTRGTPVNAQLDFDRTNSALGRVRATGRAARADGYEEARGELPIVMRSIGMQSCVAAPIVRDDELWGAVVALTTRAEPPAAGAEERLAAFAQLVGQAVANSEARRSLVEAGDETRRGLERALHEGAQQHLLALGLKLRLARERAEHGSAVAAALDDALDAAAGATDALLDLARGLHPAILTERGLAAAVQALVARTTLPVRLQRLPGRRFPATSEATAYFVVSEALMALGRDVGAGEADLLVADRGDRILVEVRHQYVADTRHALRGVARRVAAVGGRLDFDTVQDGRTVLRAEVPVEH